MASNIKEQDETAVNRLTENEADGHLNNVGSLINEHSRLNAPRLNAPEFDCDVVGDVLRLGLPEDENIAQVYDAFVNLMTPLHIAALEGHADVIRNLIDHGVDVHARDSHGCTALHIAAQKGDYDCLKMLIEAGSDAFDSIGMSCKEDAFDRLGGSALITALKHNHIECVLKLLEYGVNTHAVDENGRYFRHLVAEKAITNCMSAFLKTDSIGDSFFMPGSSFEHRIKQCAYKLLLIGKFRNDIRRNGITEIFKWIPTGIERFDEEIFKIFVLESYCIDDNIPRGLTTLRDFGFEYYNSKIAAILISCFSSRVMAERLANMNLIEHLLCISGWFETLKFVVKCKPWVPHIKSLITLPCGNKQPKHHDENSEISVLPPNVSFALEFSQTCVYIAIYDRKKELSDLELMWRDIVQGTPKYGRYPLKQPLINLIDERISDEIDQLNLIIGDELRVNFSRNCVKRSYRLRLWNLKKYLWYEKIALNPPTLLQCCRYSLLKCLGPFNVESIRKLPLPNELHSYLLLQS